MKVVFSACLAVIILGSGCHHDTSDEMTKAIVSGERAVAMVGTGSFFAGKLGVRITVSRGVGNGERRRASNGGGNWGAGVTEVTPPGEHEAYHSFENSEERTLLGIPPPPVTLHLFLTNSSAAPLVVVAVDFESDLGNFVLDPEVFTIPPGQTAQPTQMVSGLGVVSDEIPFKVTLKTGTTRETQTILVRNVLADSDKPAAK